ncbi:MAG: class I lanthipeptide [Deltaproteobacteria bacterium]|nr:class I lanthipeptide [Deltaproteobacteria bacterium]
MKKTDLRKLSLHRETLHALQDDHLEHVHGGAGTSAIVRSAWQASKAASRWISNNMCGTITVESAAESARRTLGGGGEEKK